MPIEVTHDISIKKISAGARHSIILDESGDLWIAGRQSLLNSAENLLNFTKLELKWKFKWVTCGWDISAALSEESRLFVWGNNASNQLGFIEKAAIKEPRELHLPDNEISIEVQFGLKFTAILSESRKLFITGALRSFQKSFPLKHFKVISHNSLEWLQTDTKIIHFTCGQNHIAYVTNDEDRVIHAIGDNKFGQCGRIEINEEIIRLHSGWSFNAFLTQSKRLFLYGRNDYGQLGNGNRYEIKSGAHQCMIFPVDDFDLGAEHAILKSNRNVYTWGWNEHRNCGSDSDDDV